MIKTIPNLICFGGGSIKLSTISVLFNFPTIPQIFMVFSYPKMKFSLWTFSVGCSRVSANRSGCSPSSVRVRFFFSSLFFFLSLREFFYYRVFAFVSLERSPRKQILYPRTPQRHQN